MNQIFEIDFSDFTHDKAEDVKDLHQKLSNHYKYSDYTGASPYVGDERNALAAYKFNSRPTNHYLWEKHKDNKIPLPEITPHLDNALKRVKTPHQLKVWSATQHDPRKLMNSQGIVHHPAYMSTSINPKIGARFTRIRIGEDDHNERHILHFKVPEGHPGAYLGRDFEKEFLLPRGLNLRYRKTSTIKATNSGLEPVNFHIHHMELV